MARKPRIHYSGALYHVISRGNNREWIFQNEGEKEKYRLLISQYKKRYEFKLYSWVIMSNHAHLLIQVEDISLSKIMQGIQQSYTQWYNRIHQRTGHVFEQRYKAIHCNRELYLLSLIRYIHQNPIRGGLEGLDYPWSSHRDYVNLTPDGLTDIYIPLGMFSEDLPTAHKLYLAFIQVPEKVIGTLKTSDLARGTPINHNPVPEKRTATRRKCGLDKRGVNRSLEELMASVEAFFQLSPLELAGSNREGKLTVARKTLLLLAVEHTTITQKELADKLGISQAAVSQMVSAARRDGFVRDRVEMILESL